jgi:phosphoglycerate-specific signal transduction histidine kinase
VNWDAGSISSAVRRLSDRMQEKPELAKRMKFLQAEIEETT